jgi:galactose mutarotase-like enzyme
MRALISPGLGMSLVAFSVDSVSILDEGRLRPFLDVRKGLGPIIVPHFGESDFTPTMDLGAIPHVAKLSALGVKDPFQHGVGRYSAWTFTAEKRKVRGTIEGTTRLAGIPLADLEGFGFKSTVTYELDAEGLKISFDLIGEKPVAAGIHFYYDLINRQTAVAELPVEEAPAGEQVLRLDFRQAHNTIYHPRRTNDLCTYRLTTDRYTLETTVRVRGQESQTFDCVILHSPDGVPYACIEPVSYRRGEENRKRTFRGSILLAPRARRPAGG